MELPIGLKVFPSIKSTRILKSPSLFHYSPVEDPPIDYTVREKLKTQGYRVAQNAFNKEPSPDYSGEEEFLKSSTSSLIRHQRKNIIKNTEFVIDELEHISSEDEAMTFDQIKEKVQNMNLSFRQYSTHFREPPIDYGEQQSKFTSNVSSIEKARIQSSNKHSISNVPILSEEVIEDLRSVIHGENVADVNEHRKSKVEEIYVKTKQLIENASRKYSPTHFLQNKWFAPDMPQWKRELLAKRHSRETLRQIEENAWDEFLTWKRQYATNVPLNPKYQFSPKPTL